MMTQHHGFGVWIEFGEPRRYIAHRDLECARESRERDFARLTHVDNDELVAVVEAPLEFCWGNFADFSHLDMPPLRRPLGRYLFSAARTVLQARFAGNLRMLPRPADNQSSLRATEVSTSRGGKAARMKR